MDTEQKPDTLPIIECVKLAPGITEEQLEAGAILGYDDNVVDADAARKTPPDKPFVHPQYPTHLPYAKGSPYPKRIWSLLGQSSRLVGSLLEERSFGDEWTDKPPSPGKPAPPEAKPIHSKIVIPVTPEHHDFKSGKHAKKVIPATPQKD